MENHYLRKYGITFEQKIDILREQNYECGICNRPIDEKAHLDHNHADGTIRGILCTPCNMALGLFQEDIQSLLRAVDYLKGGEKQKAR